MASLSSDQIEFYCSRLSSINKVSKQDKVRFWSGRIKDYLKKSAPQNPGGKRTQRFTFAPSELAAELTLGPLNQVPICLPQILAVLLEESAIQDAAKSTSTTIIATIFSVAMGLFSNGTRSLSSSSDDLAALQASLPKQLLHTEVLEDACSTFIKYIKANNTPLLMDEVDFMSCLKKALAIDYIDDLDSSLVIKELTRQNRLLIGNGKIEAENGITSASARVYKFQIDSATQIAPISEVDVGRVTLKRTRHNLSAQITEMEENIKR